MKTTAKHFALFKKQCQKWLDVFGLKGWESYYIHDDLSKVEGLNKEEAAVAYIATARNATFFLNTKWETPVTDKAITRAAFHEVCELLLGKLNDLARARFVMEHELDEANHAVIRTLENVLLD
jgi:hypothetical protein